jgi:hypothetical protein
MRRDRGSVFATDVKDSNLDYWSHLPSPDKDGTGWVLLVKTTVFAATVFEAFASRLFADFFVYIGRADLKSDCGKNRSCEMTLAL